MSKPSKPFIADQNDGETPEDLYFPGLIREFEVVLIIQYINTKQKLLKLSLLNWKWKNLIQRKICWSHFPEMKPHYHLTDLLQFFYSLPDLKGIKVGDIPRMLLYQYDTIQKLKGAESLGMKNLNQFKHFFILLQSPQLLNKLKELDINIKQPQWNYSFFHLLEELQSPIFLNNLLSLEKMKVFIEFQYEKKNDTPRKYIIDLRNLTSLRELKFQIKHKHQNLKIIIKNIPLSIETLFVNDDFLPKEEGQQILNQMNNLKSLQIKTQSLIPQNRLPLVQHFALNKTSLKQLNDPLLNNLLSFEIKNIPKGRIILYNLDLLREIKLIDSQIRLFAFSQVPSLTLLKIDSMMILFKEKICKDKNISLQKQMVPQQIKY